MRTFGFTILSIAVLACCSACGDDGHDSTAGTPTPSASTTPSAAAAAIVDGVYDATVQVGSRTFDDVGLVSSGPSGTAAVRVQLGNDAGVYFGGPVGEDGAMRGTGGLGITDVAYAASGQATFAEGGGVATVTGSATAPSAPLGFDAPITFSLRRPTDADATSFGGAYRFVLSRSPSGCGCPSTFEVRLAFEPTGLSRGEADTSERGESGAELGRLVAMSGTISPEGRVQVEAGYESVHEPSFGSGVALIGRLAPDGAHASGETFAGAFSTSTRVGTWTADRTDRPAHASP